MKTNILIFLIIILVINGGYTIHSIPVNSVNSTKFIYILPFGDVDVKHLTHVKKSIEDFYGYKCIITNQVNASSTFLTKSKTKYDANKILKHFNSVKNRVLLTNKDIATNKNGNPEYGIFGLGYRPGTTCIISTKRLIKNNPDSVILKRLQKIVLHELGHNFGLEHCKYDLKCLMNDAKGTIKQIDREDVKLCKRCKEIINMP